MTGQTTCCNNCNQCQYIIDTPTIVSTTTGKTRNIIGNIKCTTRNLIYIITCQKCMKQYIGETKRELKRRLYEHIYTIRNNKATPVAEHFNQPNHNLSHFKASGLCKMQSSSTQIRRKRELAYIIDFGTLSPNGINKKEG